MSESKIVIKKGEKQIIATDLVDVQHSADGVVFNFRDGSHFHIEDQNMPATVKEQMVVVEQNFGGKGGKKRTVTINADNYREPVSVDFE